MEIKRIFTHERVDLDAVCSLWAALRFIPEARNAAIHFRPANWDGAEMNEDDIAVDMYACGRGMKGRKEEGGTVHSCFASLISRFASLEDRVALASLVAYVDADDVSGYPIKHLAPYLGRSARHVIEAIDLKAVLRAVNRSTHPRSDMAVVQSMFPILNGLFQDGHSKRRAIEEAKNVKRFAGGLVALKENCNEPGVDQLLFEEGVWAIVFIEKMNIGILRGPDRSVRMDASEVRKVVEAAGETDEWFAHPAGFLYCRGSRTAKATTPSKVNPLELVNALDLAFASDMRD